MKRIKIVIYLFSLVMLFVCTACSKDIDYKALSDLGGVYSTSMKELDLSEEISGTLIDGNTARVAGKGASDSVQASTINNPGDKLLRWGISRRPNNQQPQADPGAPELLAKYGSFYLGDTSKKVLYLTFDEGYENGYTAKILDVLRDNKAQGVFFITGPYLKEHQDLVRRMVEEGHIVGNHTIHHPSLPSLSDQALEEELLGLDRAFSEKFGKNMKYLRPPKGEYSERTLRVTQKLGYVNMFWSFAYDDWHTDKSRGADYAYNKVMSNLHNGAVLLLHAVSKDNAEALDRIIKDVRKNGYEIGSVDSIKVN